MNKIDSKSQASSKMLKNQAKNVEKVARYFMFLFDM